MSGTFRYSDVYIAVRIKRGGGTGPMKPRQPPVRERCQFHQAPTTSLGDVDRAVPRPPTTDPGGGFFTYAARVSSLQGMQDPLPAGREVCLRALLRAARGRLRRATGCGPGRA